MVKLEVEEPIEKKMQLALESILGGEENHPSILLVVSKEEWPDKGGSGLKDGDWKSMSARAMFYAGAHLDPKYNTALESDEVTQRVGWMADLVAAGIEALEQVHRGLLAEGAGPARVTEYHYFGPDGRPAW